MFITPTVRQRIQNLNVPEGTKRAYLHILENIEATSYLLEDETSTEDQRVWQDLHRILLDLHERRLELEKHHPLLKQALTGTGHPRRNSGA